MRVRVLAGMLILAASGGCATMNDALTTTPESIDRPATGTPSTFVREDGLPNLNTTCQAVLLDLSDKTTIKLVRVLRTKQGDYSVPAGKYGVADDELLRVDCATARPSGIAKKE
jgi:hypothetical protein